MLNFQGGIEAENWGIKPKEINESCQKFNILMINYPIRYQRLHGLFFSPFYSPMKYDVDYYWDLLVGYSDIKEHLDDME